MKNKALAIATIKNDCKIGRRYIDCNGNTCAIGALVLAAGGELPDPDDYDNQEEIIRLSPLRELVSSFFGLNVDTLEQIQTKNDDNETSEERQTAILAILDPLPDEQ